MVEKQQRLENFEHRIAERILDLASTWISLEAIFGQALLSKYQRETLRSRVF